MGVLSGMVRCEGVLNRMMSGCVKWDGEGCEGVLNKMVSGCVKWDGEGCEGVLNRMMSGCVNSFTGNSVMLHHSCYTIATLLIHCKPRFRSQQHIFQRKSLLACQIYWIVKNISPQHGNMYFAVYCRLALPAKELSGMLRMCVKWDGEGVLSGMVRVC